MPNETKWRRYPKSLFLAISGILMLMMTTIAYADEYNFFFDKPKSGEAEANESAPATAAAPIPAAEPVRAANGPVIINNNISVPHTTVAPAASPGVAMAAVVAEGAAAPSRPRLRLGISAIALNLPKQVSAIGADTVQGMLFSIGYRFEPTFGLNGYVGQSRNTGSRTIGGLDFEWFPLNFAIGDSGGGIELGPLAGANNFYGRIDRVDALHAGARLNANFGPHFTVSLAGKVGKGMEFGELGITVNL